ncbi:UNVERIFIED_CONTAM: hypothetical protein HDU68_004965, partial [Siphonaria sp. JEL0065]
MSFIRKLTEKAKEGSLFKKSSATVTADASRANVRDSSTDNPPPLPTKVKSSAPSGRT